MRPLGKVHRIFRRNLHLNSATVKCWEGVTVWSVCLICKMAQILTSHSDAGVTGNWILLLQSLARIKAHTELSEDKTNPKLI